jgi:hypothetical protein
MLPFSAALQKTNTSECSYRRRNRVAVLYIRFQYGPEIVAFAPAQLMIQPLEI